MRALYVLQTDRHHATVMLSLLQRMIHASPPASSQQCQGTMSAVIVWMQTPSPGEGDHRASYFSLIEHAGWKTSAPLSTAGDFGEGRRRHRAVLRHAGARGCREGDGPRGCARPRSPQRKAAAPISCISEAEPLPVRPVLLLRCRHAAVRATHNSIQHKFASSTSAVGNLTFASFAR